MAGMPPSGRKPLRLTPARIGIYAFLVISAAFFLTPLYVMVTTSLKSVAEIRQGNLLALPQDPSLFAWFKAWSSACTGLTCNGIQVGFWNSIRILVPSVIASISIGALTGYTLSFWRPRGASLLFGLLMAVAFVPYQVFIYPLVRIFSVAGLNNSLLGIVIVHSIFGLPTMTLIFRNHFAALPIELFKADGGADHRRGDDPPGHRYLERLPAWPSFRRSGEPADDRAVEQRRQFHPG